MSSEASWYVPLEKTAVLGDEYWTSPDRVPRYRRSNNYGRGKSLGARFVQIDVTDDASVQAAAADVAAHEGTIDVLVNNAGVLGKVGPVEEYTGADVSAVLEVNVVGIVRVTHAFLPLLRKSPNPVIVNVSSRMGSFSMTQDPARIEKGLYQLNFRRGLEAEPTGGAAVTVRYSAWVRPSPSNPRCPSSTPTRRRTIRQRRRRARAVVRGPARVG